jgi:hypothetical protein
MAVDKKNIDQLFRDNLEGFKENPPLYSWEKLKDDLVQARKRKKAILYRWMAAAAVFIFAFISGYFYASYKLNDRVSQNTSVSLPANIQKPLSTASLSENTPSVSNMKEQLHSEENQNVYVKPEVGAETELSDVSASGKKDKTIDNMKNAVPATESNTQLHAIETTTEQIRIEANKPELLSTNVLTDQIAEKNTIPITGKHFKPIDANIQPGQKVFTYGESLETGKRDVNKQWSIGGQFSPVYSYRNIQIMNEDLPPNVISDENYYDAIESGIYSYAGGIDVQYLFREKLSFQTGVYYSKIGQMNEDIVAFQYPDDKYLYYANTSAGTIPINPISLPAEIQEVSVRDTAENLLYINSNIYQDFEYIEIPLLLKYRIFNKRLSLNLSGGLSPGIMVGNHAYFQYQDQRFDLDRSEEFYPVIYNSIVGLGLDYAISKKLKLNLAPTFKYSLQSIRKDHSIEYYPYSFSIFTGIHYNF